MPRRSTRSKRCVISPSGEGVDFAFEATGVPVCVRQAVEMLAYAGTAVAIGVPPIPSDVRLPWSGSEGAAYPNKATLLITDGGDPHPGRGLPADGRLVPRRAPRPGRHGYTRARRSTTRRGFPGHARRRGHPLRRAIRRVARRVASAAMRTSELNHWWSVVSAISNILMRAVFRVHVEGESNVPSQGAAIVAFNHISVIDGPAVGIVVARRRRRESRFLVAAEVFRQRVAGLDPPVVRPDPHPTRGGRHRSAR